MFKTYIQNVQVTITKEIGCPFFLGKTRRLMRVEKILSNFTESWFPAPTPWGYNVDITSLSFQWPMEVVFGYYRKIMYFSPMPKEWTLYKRFPMNYISEFLAFPELELEFLFLFSQRYFSLHVLRGINIFIKIIASFTHILIESN